MKEQVPEQRHYCGLLLWVSINLTIQCEEMTDFQPQINSKKQMQSELIPTSYSIGCGQSWAIEAPLRTKVSLLWSAQELIAIM